MKDSHASDVEAILAKPRHNGGDDSIGVGFLPTRATRPAGCTGAG